MKIKTICVIGLGYIGLPTASTFAQHGLQVFGVDNNPAVIDSLKKGKVHIHEPGLNNLVQSVLKSKRLTISPHPVPADAFIITVPTPFFADKRADMRAVVSAVESIVPHLQKGNLVVLESTSPPRTTLDLVIPILETSGLTAGKDFHMVYSPETVYPGQILKELIDNDRVVGGMDAASSEAGRELYTIFVKGQIYTTSTTTAEMVKLMQNTYRDINIATANEFSLLSDRFGTDVWEAIQLANKHPRVKILNPGPGVGGHCISVDPWFFVEAAPDITPLVRTARQVNDSQPKFVLDLVKRAMRNCLAQKQAALLGLSFKPEVDDLRESPAIEVGRLLAKEGVKVTAFEPFKPDATFEEFTTVKHLEEALRIADFLLVLVNHACFRDLKPLEIKKLTPARLVIDCVNCFDFKAWQSAGFQVFRLGVGGSHHP